MSEGSDGRTSAYTIFAEDRKRMGDSEGKIDERWRKMSRRQKDSYRKRAKEYNEGKANTISIPAELQTSYMDRMVKNLLINKARMKKIIKKEVTNQFEIGKLDDFTFTILTINNFYEDEHNIFPCEMAMAKFSLKEGVKDSMSVTINPGPLPAGSECEALLHSHETHNYSLPKPDDKEQNYIQVLLKMIRFLRPEFNEMPIFYTEGGTINNRTEQKLLINTKRALERILEKSGEYEIADEVQVFPLSYLFYRLHKCIKSEQGMKSTIVDVDQAHLEFKENQFYKFITDGCDFHNIKEKQTACCLSKVRRYGYTLAQFCSQPNKYPLIRGQHFPLDYEI